MKILTVLCIQVHLFNSSPIRLILENSLPALRAGKLFVFFKQEKPAF